jgi:hypothetical protein
VVQRDGGAARECVLPSPASHLTTHTTNHPDPRVLERGRAAVRDDDGGRVDSLVLVDEPCTGGCLHIPSSTHDFPFPPPFPPQELTVRTLEEAPPAAAPAEASTDKPAAAPAPAASSSSFAATLISGTTEYWRSLLRPADAPTRVVTAADYPRARALAGPVAWIDNYFRISDRGSSFYTEFTGGMTTFFAMCYILALNGVIVSSPLSFSKRASFFATALSAGIFTTLMGVLVNVPVALAPGMGLNGYFASVVNNQKLTWTDAMGAVFISGIFYLFFTFSGLRTMLFRAVPKGLRAAITVGIGFFITIIG